MEVRILIVKDALSSPATGLHERGVRVAKVEEGEATVRRRKALRRLDKELEKGNCKAALSLMKQLKAHPGGLLRGFGAAALAKLAGKRDISSLQFVIDAILHSVKHSLEFQMQDEDIQILTQDSREMMDADCCSSVYEDHLMCMQHEAGHFLVGYMLGVLPRRFKVPSIKDLLLDKFACGKVEFVGFEFLREVSVIDLLSDRNFCKGKLNKETLTKFSRVTLGGLTAEHLLFGYSDLLHSDVQKLDRVLNWLGFTQDEVDSEHRLAAEDTVFILSSQIEALSSLAEAMASGRSVGSCIETIEHRINLNNIL